MTFQAQRCSPTVPERIRYENLDDVRKDSARLPFPWFLIPTPPDQLEYGLLQDFLLVHKVVVNEDLSASVFTNGELQNKLSVINRDIKKVLKETSEKTLCEGITADHLLRDAIKYPSPSKYHQEVLPTTTGKMYRIRSAACVGTTESQEVKCTPCTKLNTEMEKKHQKEPSKEALKRSTPLCHVSRQKLETAFKTLRKKEKLLADQVANLKKKVRDDAITVSKDLHQSLTETMNTSDITDPFAKLFWHEQKKGFAVKQNGMRWHPMMIRLAIMLHCQSPSAYRSLRETGILKLPGESTLRDYSNAIHPTQGFNTAVLEKIKHAAANFEDHQRYVVLLHDEITIKSDLVFDRRSQEVIGFINPQNWEVQEDQLATHVLVFMVVGVNTNLKMTVGYFPTRTATAVELVGLLWEAIGYLETFCKLKVLSIMSS